MRPSMRPRTGVTARTTSRMTRRPALIGMVRLLEKPIAELESELREELASNPALELADPASADSTTGDTITSSSLSLPDSMERNQDSARRDEWASDSDGSLNPADGSPRPTRDRFDDEAEWYQDRLNSIPDAATDPDRPTLAAVLREQLLEFDVGPGVRRAALWIIERLNEDGRLPGSPKTLAAEMAMQSGDPPERFHEALALVWRMEPRGVGAQNLRESLQLQVDDSAPMAMELRTLLGDDAIFDNLLHQRRARILKRTGWTPEFLTRVMERLKTLNPHPGEAFRHERRVMILPDMAAVPIDELAADGGRSGDGENGDAAPGRRFRVEMRRGWVSRLRVDRECRELIRRLRVPRDAEMVMMDAAQRQEAERNRQLRDQLRRAEMLVEAIPLRRETLRRVAQGIVDHQTAFLECGAGAIVPLRMEEVARRVGVDVSTVSRAVKDKWIETPSGILPLKRFFTGGTISESGESVASDVVRQRLREVIAEEDPIRPFSDEILRRELARRFGLKISRRAVTKYRSELGISDSRLRRHDKEEEQGRRE